MRTFRAIARNLVFVGILYTLAILLAPSLTPNTPGCPWPDVTSIRLSLYLMASVGYIAGMVHAYLTQNKD
jgi:hypothetical protein